VIKIKLKKSNFLNPCKTELISGLVKKRNYMNEKKTTKKVEKKYLRSLNF